MPMITINNNSNNNTTTSYNNKDNTISRATNAAFASPEGLEILQSPIRVTIA